MSILSQLFSGLTDKDKTESVTHPCQNCESNCSVCPSACDECKPYKEKLIDALYNVEHIDDFYNKYEIVSSDTASSGTTTCPFCGAPVTSSVCEFCGSRISESNGKIQVTTANDIPNPIIEARNLIYERRLIIDKYSDTSDSDSSGILSSLVSSLTGSKEEDDHDNTMTESEIKNMAAKYGVSVRDYLEGLDMGTYLSKTAYENQQSTPSYSGSGLAAGAAGLGAAGMLFGNGLSNKPQGNRPPMDQQGFGGQHMGPPPMDGQNRPDHSPNSWQNGNRPNHQGNSMQGFGHNQNSGNRPGSGFGGRPQGGRTPGGRGSGGRTPGGRGR